VRKFAAKISNLLLALIREGTGVSTRSALMLWGMGYASILTVHFIALDWVAVARGQSVPVNYVGWGIVLGGIAATVLAVVWGKSKQDQYATGITEGNRPYPET
jgi:hypothetical protein